MSDSSESVEEDDGTISATPEEIEKWEKEHDEPHPVFQVDHRPERKPVMSDEPTAVGQTTLEDFED